MLQPLSKKSLNTGLILFLQISNGFSYIWMDENPENQLYDDGENRIEEQKFINKKNERSSISPEVFKRTFHSLVNSGSIPIYQTNNNKHCNCELSFGPVDLGRDYYPRYLQTGICKPNSCEKYYQCVENKYNVKVLRKRNLKENDELSGPSLPKPLRDFWVAETVPVGVACECVVDTQIPSADSL